MNIEGVVIACAGYGSRLGLGIPKCMVEINGKTILTRLIESIQPLVPNINIVVGYRHDLIIEYCRKYHKNVKIVHNPDYQTTNTAYSIHLGSINFKHKVLYLDGDLIIEQNSLKNFIQAAKNKKLLIGITNAKSSEAVFVTTEQTESFLPIKVHSFQRKTMTSFEWANIFIGSPEILKNNSNYVYENLIPHLPADAFNLELHEIDTPEDLARAKSWLNSHEVIV